MIRKVTELEQKLLDNGWKLESKLYCGKNRQLTSGFFYQKVFQVNEIDFIFSVFLDNKRTKALNFRCETIYIAFYYCDLLIQETAFANVRDELWTICGYLVGE